MEYASVFMAMSRVKSADHIRLICHNSRTSTQDMLYLEDLKPDPYIRAFHKGFHSHDQWSAKRALS
jgi:hypothetical protein